MASDRNATPPETKVPETFYVFVNQAGFRTRHNLHLTGCFISGGFAAAFPEEVPVGTVALHGPGPDAPRDEELRRAFLNGASELPQDVL